MVLWGQAIRGAERKVPGSKWSADVEPVDGHVGGLEPEGPQGAGRAGAAELSK